MLRLTHGIFAQRALEARAEGIGLSLTTAFTKLCVAGEKIAATRRLSVLEPPRIGDTHGRAPTSPAMVSDEKALSERGWARDYQRLSKRRLSGVIAKPSDFQLHEVYGNTVIRLTDAPRRLDLNVGQGQGDHFHFVLLRHRLALMPLLELLNKLCEGSIPLEAFRVSMATSEASGIVTQRISVRSRDLLALGLILKGVNEMAADGPELTFARLQPIGFSDTPCQVSGKSCVQYTLLIRGVSRATPQQSLRMIGSVLHGRGIVNYVNPLCAGGTQPITALAGIHRAVKSDDLLEAAAMLTALSGRSGHLLTSVREVKAVLDDDPRAVAAANQILRLDDRLQTRAPWFAKAVSIVTSNPDVTPRDELHSLFHIALPLHLRKAIKYSSPLLAWNAGASAIVSHYNSTEQDGGGGLRLPIADEEEGSGLGDSDFALSLQTLPWDCGLTKQSVSPQYQRPLPPFAISEDTLGDVCLPVGLHPYKGSPANIGWAAIGGADLVGNDCSGFRPLFVKPRNTKCYVIYDDHREGKGGYMSGVARGGVREVHLKSDLGLGGTTFTSSDTRHDLLAARIPQRHWRNASVVCEPRKASGREMTHSLAITFQLPTLTDPAGVLAGFMDVRSDLTFVPEDNGMHISLSGPSRKVSEPASSPRASSACQDEGWNYDHRMSGNLLRMP